MDVPNNRTNNDQKITCTFEAGPLGLMLQEYTQNSKDNNNAADKVTENLKDYSDFVSEVELSKIAINVSGITPEDLEGSYWSDPEEFDSAGGNYGGSDLSSYISSSSGDEDEVMD